MKRLTGLQMKRILSRIFCLTLTAPVILPFAFGRAIAGLTPVPPAMSQEAAQKPETKPETVVLEPGKVLDREIAGGESHPYEISLSAGQYASLIVDQRGIVLAVDILDTNENVMIEFNYEIKKQGQERVELVADSAITYHLIVRPCYPKSAPGRYQLKVAEVRAANEKERSVFEAHKLATVSDKLDEAGKYDDAIKSSGRALELAENALGPDDLFVADLLLRQARDIRTKGDFAKAEPLFQRAVDIDRKVLGEEDFQTALAITNLGLTLLSKNDFVGAASLFEKAIGITERTMGPEDPHLALCLMNLALTRNRRGDYEGAVVDLQRALAIYEKMFGPDDTFTMKLTYNLASTYIDMRRRDLAKPLMERVLAIMEKRYGPDHPNLAYPLQDLGIIARHNKEYDLALEYLWRSEKIREKSIGARNPLTATLLVNIGNVYNDKRDYPKAMELFQHALEILETGAGPYDRNTLKTLASMVRTSEAMNDFADANEYQARVDQIIEKSISFNLAVGSERERLAYIDSIGEYMERSISMNVREAPNDKRAAEAAATALLQRKGRVLDALSESVATLRQHLKPEDQKLLDELGTTTTELAKLALNGPKKTPLADYQKQLLTLEQKREKLEFDVSQRSEGYYVPANAVTLDSVKAVIPNDAVLLEFAVYRPYDPKAPDELSVYGEPRYAAYVIPNKGDVRSVDLGPAAQIDATVDALREALGDPKRDDAAKLARALDHEVMEPLRPLVRDARHLLVSPDGELNLVPFEVLVDEQHKFLVEGYSITYLTTGRDLLRMQVARKSQSDPLVVANPIFGEPTATLTAKADASKLKSIAVPSQRRSVTTGADLSSIYFAPLPGTAQEARAIQSLFPEAKILTGTQATKSALKQTNAPSILHIATHGFFLQDPPETVSQDGTNRDTSAAASPGPAAKAQNPLLRSGLALSGANLTRGGSEDGILTGLEASGLNLWGTRLVTLSACETGVGKVKNGEGVYGLRRAFFLAGTETLVMSLWEVSDRVTDEMMTSYYSGLKQGLGRGEALRQAQLTMLKRKDHQHPFYWASFIQAGEWANLDGKR
jgi:CHAT domain-containing protein